MTDDFDFLGAELNKELIKVFGRGANTERILSYWNQTIKISERQTREIEERGLTPKKHRKVGGDVGVYVAPEHEDTQVVKLLDNGELKSKEFYRGVISGILLHHKQVAGEGWVNHYKSPIAYCVSQLKTVEGVNTFVRGPKPKY